MLNKNNDGDTGVYRRIFQKLIDQGLSEDRAKILMETKMAEVEYIQPPDTYSPINADDEWAMLRVMLEVGHKLQTKTIMLARSFRGRLSVKRALKALRQRNPKLMSYVSDKFAHDCVRYAITNMGLLRSKKIDQHDILKRSHSIVWFDKTTDIEIDYDKGEIVVPFVDGNKFTIRVNGITKRDKLRNIRVTRNFNTTEGMFVHVHHNDDVLDERDHVQGILNGLDESDVKHIKMSSNKKKDEKRRLDDIFGNN